MSLAKITSASPVRVLSFSITSERRLDFEYVGESREELEVEKQVVIVRPLVDGKPITDAYVFDVVDMITLGPDDTEFYPFTCSCGVAGCAGIYAPTIQKTENGILSWYLPDEEHDGFRSNVNTEVIAPDQPLVLSFDKEQFEKAVADLETSLIALNVTQEVPLMLELGFNSIEIPWSQYFDECRKRHKDWQDQLAERKARFGNLFGGDVIASFNNGMKVSFTVTELVFELTSSNCNQIHRNDVFDFEEIRLLNIFRNDEKAMLKAIKHLSWEQVSPLGCWFYEDDYSEHDCTPKDDASLSQELWEKAMLEVKHFVPRV